MAVKIILKKRRTGAVESLRVSGHAGFAESGEDIVCAAVSALVQTALLGIAKLHGGEDFYRMEKGFLEFTVPPLDKPGHREKADFLMDTVCRGLEEIENQYGGFVKIRKIVIK